MNWFQKRRAKARGAAMSDILRQARRLACEAAEAHALISAINRVEACAEAVKAGMSLDFCSTAETTKGLIVETAKALDAINDGNSNYYDYDKLCITRMIIAHARATMEERISGSPSADSVNKVLLSLSAYCLRYVNDAALLGRIDDELYLLFERLGEAK